MKVEKAGTESSLILLPTREHELISVFVEKIRSQAPKEEIEAAGIALTQHINNQKSRGVAGE